MKVRIQYRFLLALLAAVAIGGGIVFAINRFQVSRHSSVFLTQARRAVEAGKPADAIPLYTQYLGLKRDSADAQAELGEVYVEQRNFDRAFFYLEGALRLEPERQESRQSLVNVAMGLGRFADAKTHLSEHLVPADPENAEYQWLLGRCEERLGNSDVAREHLERAIQGDTSNPLYAMSLADLLTNRMNQATAARSVLDQAVTNAADNPIAYLVRGRWLIDQSRRLAVGDNAVRGELLATAWEDAETAFRLGEGSPESVLFLVEAAVANGRAADAKEAVQTAIAAYPRIAEFYASASRIELSSGDKDAALEILVEGLKAIPGNPGLLFNRAQLELDAGNLETTERLIAELRAAQYQEAPIRFLEARVMARQGQWRGAATLLENSRALFDRSEDLLRQVDSLLAYCYRNLGNTDQELEALRRALNADPMSISLRESLALVLMQSGRVDEAIAEFSKVALQPQASVGTILSLARLMFVDGLGRGVEGAGWDPLRQVLNKLDAVPEAASDLAIMRAELLVTENREAEAEALLRSRIEADPTMTGLHQALISLQIRRQDWEAAEASLAAAQSALPDSATMRLEQARYWIRRQGKQVDIDLLERLAVPDEAWEESEKIQLAGGFAAYFLSLEDYDRGEQFARLVADSDLGRANLSIHLLLFDLALRSGNLEGMNRSLQQVYEIEGNGPMWRVGEAIRLTVEAGDLEKTKVAERQALYKKAIEQLAEAAVERPGWSRIARLKGEIYDRQGREDLALQAYLEAISLGEQNPQLVSRAIMLLFSKGRFVDADAVVRKLQEQKAPFSSELTRVASQVSLQLENLDRALSLANDWAIESDQQEARVWLAQMHSMAGNYEEAEQEFRIAIEKDPAQPGPWVALVQMFGRQGDRESATATIQEAQASIAASDLDGALAQAYQSIQDFAQAEQSYLAGVAKDPENISLLRRFADFYLSSGRPELAEPLLVKIASDDNDAPEFDRAWARRSLALALGMRGDDKRFREAQALIATNVDRIGQTSEDQRTLAVILAMRPDQQSLAEATRTLEDVVRNQSTYSLSDNHLLAQLYLRAGDWARYSRMMRGVLGRGGADETRYVKEYAEALVKRGELDDGKLWFGRLKSLAPQELSTDTIEARLLFRAGDFTALLTLLERNAELAERWQWAAQASETFGAELVRKGNSEEGGKLLTLAKTLHTQIATSDPQRSLAVAAFHARQGEFEQSFALLDGDDLPAEELAALGNWALQTGQLTDDQAARLVEIITATQQRNPDNVSINMCLGDLASWMRDGDTAAEAYRRILSVQANDIGALNNLAMVLAMTGRQLDEASGAIDQAIKLTGPVDYLLDTRGIVRLAAGNLADAEKDFRAALASSPQADRHLHLAQALVAQERIAEAKAAFQMATEGGLTVEVAHPLERPVIRRLAETLR